jgi:hypothetical protein
MGRGGVGVSCVDLIVRDWYWKSINIADFQCYKNASGPLDHFSSSLLKNLNSLLSRVSRDQEPNIRDNRSHIFLSRRRFLN